MQQGDNPIIVVSPDTMEFVWRKFAIPEVVLDAPPSPLPPIGMRGELSVIAEMLDILMTRKENRLRAQRKRARRRALRKRGRR